VTEFEKLFDDNRDFIFKYLIKMTRDASLAEELTQETFFRAYMNFSSLRNKEKASSWLCKIAQNSYYSWYNEQKNYASADSLEAVIDETDTEYTVIQNENNGYVNGSRLWNSIKKADDLKVGISLNRFLHSKRIENLRESFEAVI